MANYLTGTVKFIRSDHDGPHDCKCCEGPHVFCRYVDYDLPDEWPEWRARTVINWLVDLLANETEGKRVKITVEFETLT